MLDRTHTGQYEAETRIFDQCQPKKKKNQSGFTLGVDICANSSTQNLFRQEIDQKQSLCTHTFPSLTKHVRACFRQDTQHAHSGQIGRTSTWPETSIHIKLGYLSPFPFPLPPSPPTQQGYQSGPSKPHLNSSSEMSSVSTAWRSAAFSQCLILHTVHSTWPK